MRELNPSAGKAHSIIRKKIMSAEFPAGAILSAKHLAENIGVSRTPVRDALRELETEGLVVLAPRQEARVKSATFEEFRDLCELRIALETHAAGLAATRRTAEDLENMRQTLEAMRNLVQELSETNEKEEAFSRMAQEDIRFHAAVIDAARNKLLRDEVIRFQVIARVVKAPSDGKGGSSVSSFRNRPLDVWESHLRIYEGIRMHRGEEAKNAMEQHLVEGMKAQLKAIRDLEENSMVQFM